MSLLKRLEALEGVGFVGDGDMRTASTAQLVLYLAQTPCEGLREELRNLGDADFAAVMGAIREYCPSYGVSNALT